MQLVPLTLCTDGELPCVTRLVVAVIMRGENSGWLEGIDLVSIHSVSEWDERRIPCREGSICIDAISGR